jgi:hypothetical protein
MNSVIEHIIWEAGKFAQENSEGAARESSLWQGLFIGRYTELLLEECIRATGEEEVIRYHFGLDPQ